MKQDYTHLIIILDGSGSMLEIQRATIEGVNSLVAQQAEQPGTLSTALYTFNHMVKEVKEFTALTPETYNPCGSTALLDSVCFAIDNEGSRLSNKLEQDRPNKVVVVIVTDGEENASTLHNLEGVTTRVATQKDTYKWEFVFLGANIDAFKVGGSYGFVAKSTMQWQPDANSIKVMYSSVGNSLTNYRSGVTAAVDLTTPTA